MKRIFVFSFIGGLCFGCLLHTAIHSLGTFVFFVFTSTLAGLVTCALLTIIDRLEHGKK